MARARRGGRVADPRWGIRWRSGGDHVELLTFGHGTASADEIVSLLRGAGVQAVVDVRTAPGSRRNPHVGRAELERWLPFAYRWERRLGGFRRAAPDSPDVAWRNDAFRGYAGYTRDPRFLAAVDELLAAAAGEVTTVMCSESVWWRCHRRIIADFVTLVRGVAVRHLMHDGRLDPHRPSGGVRVREDGLLVYDVGQGTLGTLLTRTNRAAASLAARRIMCGAVSSEWSC